MDRPPGRGVGAVLDVKSVVQTLSRGIETLERISVAMEQQADETERIRRLLDKMKVY